jgi:hypothetical protein
MEFTQARAYYVVAPLRIYIRGVLLDVHRFTALAPDCGGDDGESISAFSFGMAWIRLPEHSLYWNRPLVGRGDQP